MSEPTSPTPGRHIVITVEAGKSPVVDIRDFNMWEASQIVYYAYRALENDIEMPTIVGGGE